MQTTQNMYADAEIKTARLLTRSTTHPNAAIQANGGTAIFLGVSSNASRLHPDPNFTDAQVEVAAVAGENVGVYPPGATGVDLLCGAAWTPGQPLMADSQGKGIPATAGLYYGAIAQTAGVVGSLCPVDVVSGLVKT